MINKLAWKIGGEAGYGIMTAGQLFSLICKNHGLHVLGITEYPSLIRGGHNTFTVRVEDAPLTSHLKFIDVLCALDELTVYKHVNELTMNGALIYDSKMKIDMSYLREDLLLVPIPLDELSSAYANKKVMMASIAIGATSALVGLDLEVIKSLIKKIFKKKGEQVIKDNIDSIKAGFDSVALRGLKFKNSINKVPIDKSKIYISGNDAISLGAIQAGCKFISAYPMTPATSIFETIINYSKKCKVMTFQSEDEIAAINNALGASFAGARSMTCTSGGGFALMNESISLAGCSEIPIVIVLAQRPGPATGLPTRTEQGDLLHAVYSGQGEFLKCVLAPGDVNECFTMTTQAFNIADKFQIPVILMTDKYLGVTQNTVNEFKTDNLVIDRGALITDSCTNPGDGYKFRRYLINDSGISPRPIPGVRNGFHCAIGDEHDEEGGIIESRDLRIKMADKRTKKINHLINYVKGSSVEAYGDNESDIVIVSWGSTKGVILEAQKYLKLSGIKTRFVQVKVINPFPKDEFIAKLGDYKKLVVVENNMTSQLGTLIKGNTNLNIDYFLLRYDGRSFNPEDINDNLRWLYGKR